MNQPQRQPPHAILQFCVHLINGRMTVLSQFDINTIDHTLARFGEPERVFAHQDLIIGHDRKTTMFRRQHITHIDVIGACVPDWPFPLDAASIIEITEEQFHVRFEAPTGFDPLHGDRWSSKPGHVYTVVEIEFLNGKRMYWQIERSPQHLMGADVVPLEHNMFVAGGLHAKRAGGGGVVIINPTNVSRYTFHPGMTDLPITAISAAHAESQ
ncbi:MAG: PA domain-containing protein [Capsulimonadaceae bacterium]